MSGAEVMLINPRRKRRRSRRRARVTHARRNPRRRRRAMTPLQMQYFGGGRRKRSRRRSRRVTHMQSNPRPSYRPRRRRGRVVRFRRNPIDRATFGAFVGNTLIPASVGAGGALALDLLWGYLPLPATVMTGTFAPLARLAGAVAIGWAVGSVTGKRYGEEAMAGAVTVTLYDLVKGYITSNMPGVTLSAYVGGGGRSLGYIAPAVNTGMGAYVGEYVY